jgi:hypothetical protein
MSALGLKPWSRIEIGAALAVVLIVLVPITSKVTYSGAWDGDPSTHNLLVRDTVNTVVDEHAKGGDPLRGFLQCYHRYPKMLHEILLSAFILALNGMHRISFADVERVGAWFATLWTLAGFVVLYHFLRLFFSRMQALAVVPIVALSGYILMYANFPRQNMPSHVLCWLSLVLYIKSRFRPEGISTFGILASGVVFGMAVAVHYGATYLFFAFVGIEVALFFKRRQFTLGITQLALSLAGAALVWVALDIFYFYYSAKYPGERNFDGVVITVHHSFLEGMVFTANGLSNRIAAFKLEDRSWWFLPGFFYRSFGPIGSLMALLGVGSIPFLMRGKATPCKAPAVELLAAMVAILVVSALVSLEYFQNGRKLMPFYPVWCVFLGYGLFALGNWISALGERVRRRLQGPSRTVPGFFAGGAVVALIAVHFAVIGPALLNVYQCRRDAGYMRAYLAEHGIRRILVDSTNFDSQMAPEQRDIKYLTIADADEHEFIVLHRLYKKDYSKTLMDELRPIEPIVSFRNQVATPLFWYEFPLKKDFMDFDDKLTNERSLYRWKDVRAFFAPFCMPH